MGVKNETDPAALNEDLELYRKLLLARLCEEKIRELYPQDDIKTPVHLGIGGEAIPVGVCHALPKESKYFGTYRNHTLFLTLSENTDLFFAELYGKATGPCKGKGGSMHLMDPATGLVATSAVVATTIPVAVGVALANQYRQSDDLVAVFFGDGAMEEGVFWESLNFACLKKLGILFVCEDNELAIHALATHRQGFDSVSEAVQGFDCHQVSGDGTDVLNVIRHTQDILKKIKKERKPGFLHLNYFRFLEHVGINEDFEAGYRKPLSPQDRKAKDPLSIMEKHLASQKTPDSLRANIEKDIFKKIESSVERAKAAPFPIPDELYKDVLA